MPIIFGGPNLCKNFKDVGLFTWNEYFGYEGDELNDDDINKIESYRRVINKVNSATSANLQVNWTLGNITGANAHYFTGTVT